MERAHSGRGHDQIRPRRGLDVLADGLGRQREGARRQNSSKARLVRVHAAVRGDGHGTTPNGPYYNKTRRALRTVRQGLHAGLPAGHGHVGRRRRDPLPDLQSGAGARRLRGGPRGDALRRRREGRVGELPGPGRSAFSGNRLGDAHLPVERLLGGELRVRGRAHRRGQRVPRGHAHDGPGQRLGLSHWIVPRRLHRPFGG